MRDLATSSPPLLDVTRSTPISSVSKTFKTTQSKEAWNKTNLKYLHNKQKQNRTLWIRLFLAGWCGWVRCEGDSRCLSVNERASGTRIKPDHWACERSIRRSTAACDFSSAMRCEIIKFDGALSTFQTERYRSESKCQSKRKKISNWLDCMIFTFARYNSSKVAEKKSRDIIMQWA